MLTDRFRFGRMGVLAFCILFCATAVRAADPLPSWNDGPAKTAITSFMERVTREGGPDFVPVAERIATFDNDGTLWCEMPMYTQVVFAFERAKMLAPQHPDWKTKEPFASLLSNDPKKLAEIGEKGLLEIVAVTHTGVTTDDFHLLVRDWISSARHPRFKRPYTECVYQPMLEVLSYFRANQFKTYIVSGGGIDFMRPWTDKTYGIPPEQVVGSSGKLKFEVHDGTFVIEKVPEIDFVDDGPGKPVGIEKFIGRRPIAAFGNSDGDLQMLQWTTTGSGVRLGAIVHHTDAEREYAYDRKSHVGRLDKALDEAGQRGWTVVDMKNEWKTIFPPEKPK